MEPMGVVIGNSNKFLFVVENISRGVTRVSQLSHFAQAHGFGGAKVRKKFTLDILGLSSQPKKTS